ncbi:hypothetical protein OKW41_004710 [Paraburkholderia sp. UCT70]
MLPPAINVGPDIAPVRFRVGQSAMVATLFQEFSLTSPLKFVGIAGSRKQHYYGIIRPLSCASVLSPFVGPTYKVLTPAPASRLREAYSHLQYSTALLQKSERFAVD